METTDKRRKFIINVVYWAIIAGITYLIFRYLLNLLLPFVIALLVAWLLRPLSRLYRQRAPKVASALIIVTVLLFYLLLGFLAMLLLIYPAICALVAFVWGWILLRRVLKTRLPGWIGKVGDTAYAISGKFYKGKRE